MPAPAREHECEKEYRCCSRNTQIDIGIVALEWQKTNQRTKAKYQEYIENVRSDNISDGDIRISSIGGNSKCGHFREGCPDGNDS